MTIFGRIKKYIGNFSIEAKILGGMLFLITVFKIYYSTLNELHFDEAFQWMLTKDMSLNYYRQMPFTVWFMWFFTSLAGDYEISIRLGNIMASLFSSILVYFLGQEVSGSRRIGLYSAILLNCIPIFFIESTVGGMPEILEIFFYSAILLFFLKAISNKAPIYWGFMGISLGLGFLTRYTVILIVPILFIFLVTSKCHKKWLYRKDIYVALGIAFIIVLPHLLWNITNQMVTFKWLIYNRGFNNGALHFSVGNLTRLIQIHSIFFSPFLYFLFLISTLAGGYLALKQKKENQWFLFLSSAPLMGIMFLSGAFLKIFDGDWFMTAFVPATIFTSILFTELLQRFKNCNRVLSISAIISCTFGIIFTGVFVFYLTKGCPACLPEDIKIPIKVFHGWKEISKKLDEINKQETMSSGKGMALLSDDYYLVSELLFYSQNKSVYFLNTRNTIYLRDFEMTGKIPEGQNAIFITQNPDNITAVKSMFKTIEEEPMFTSYLKDEPIRRFYIFKCYR